jgi:membrane protease YdiL (CAAX protease family)
MPTGERLASPFARLEAGRLAIGALASLVASGVATWAVSWIWPHPAVETVLFGLTWHVLFLAFLVYAGRRATIVWPRLLGITPRGVTVLRVAAAAVPLLAISVGAQFLVLLPLSYALPAWAEATLIEGCLSATEMGGSISSIIDAGVTILLAPVTEELLCRGYLLHRWGFRWGTRRAVLLTSLLFGLLHVRPEQIVSGFAHGWVFSLVYLETGALTVPVALHALNNLLAVVASLAPSSGVCSIAALRSAWWLGALGVAVGVPWLIVFCGRRRELLAGPLPYAAPAAG